MDDLVYLIVRFFKLVFDADERPEARRITVGFAVAVFAFIGLMFLYGKFAK
jgi:hypothetical protein